MRSTDAIRWASSQEVHYVPDERVPDLPTSHVDVDDRDDGDEDLEDDGAEDDSGTSIDGELLDDVERILREQSTPDDPVTSGEISDQLDLGDGETNPRAREAVRVLTDERELPIGSSSQGYFLISREGELETYLENLDARIAGIQERKTMVADAYEAYKERIAESDG